MHSLFHNLTCIARGFLTGLWRSDQCIEVCANDLCTLMLEEIFKGWIAGAYVFIPVQHHNSDRTVIYNHFEIMLLSQDLCFGARAFANITIDANYTFMTTNVKNCR